MAKVFIIEPPRRSINVLKAEEFGNLIYVFESNSRRCSAFQSVEFGKTVLKVLSEKGYDPVVDHICIVGSMLTVAIALVAIAQSCEHVNILLFDSVHGCYVSKHFNRSDWKEFKDAKDNTAAIANY